jgi:hypothetical protein
MKKIKPLRVLVLFLFIYYLIGVVVLLMVGRPTTSDCPDHKVSMGGALFRIDVPDCMRPRKATLSETLKLPRFWLRDVPIWPITIADYNTPTFVY